MTGGGGVVALLFTDLVGSTKMLDQLGDEAAEELRRTHFEILRRVLADFGGREIKNLGDGIMATFDSPVGGTQCAVAMQRALAEHNRANPKRTLEVRIGVHAGEPLREDQDFFGAAVVIAKRLCDQAKGGEIVASEVVAGLVGSRGGVPFRRVGRLRLKGLTDPVAAVTVDWNPPPAVSSSPAPAARARRAAPAPRGPRLVGRDRELARLQTVLTRAAAGEFRCVLVVADSGVGKTRLAGELLARSQRRALCLWGRGYPFGQTAPFAPWSEALERHLSGLASEEVAQLCGGFLDDLAGLLRSVASARGSAPDREPPRLRLLEGMAILLRNLSARSTVLLHLDDIHLADASSWEGLDFLARNLVDARLMVIATARPAELAATDVPTDVLLGLEQEGLLERVTLGPLERDAVRELAEGVLGAQPPRPLIDWLLDRSRGNPLFALGLLRALVDEGADLSAPQLRYLPEALADRVVRRLSVLDDAAVATLEMLAIVGRRIEATDLATVSDLTKEQRGEVLRGLARSRLVVEDERGPELTYEIAHPLIQEAIYQSIGGARRRSLHRVVARALMESGRLGEAAAHFARSAAVGDPEAIGALREAIRQAEEQEAYREALTILSALVELLPAGDRRWLEILDAVSWQAEWVADHRAEAQAAMGIPAIRAIDRLLEGAPDAGRRASVKFRLTSFLAWGSGLLDEAETTCREALSLFEEAGDQHGALLAENELAWVRGLQGDFTAMEAGFRHVLESAEAAADESVVMRASHGLGFAALVQGKFEEAHAALERSIAISREHRQLYRMTMSTSIRAWTLGFGGRVRECNALLAEAKALNLDWRETVLGHMEVVFRWLSGDFLASLASAREALAWSPGGPSRRRDFWLPYAAMAATENDQLGEAEKYLAMARASYGDRSWFFYSEWYVQAEAVQAWRGGNRSEALSGLRRAAARLVDMNAAPLAALVLVDLAEAAACADDVDTAAESAARLDAVAERLDFDLFRGLAAIAGAWSALASGAAEVAADRGREALRLLSDSGYNAFLGRALDVVGRSLAALGRTEAVTFLRQAADTFERCGALWRRDRAVEGLRALGGVGRRAAAAALGPSSLTPREREVALLATQGHSAREIGERLFIGERTVETHLTNVYAKLGVASKRELMRHASDLSL